MTTKFFLNVKLNSASLTFVIMLCNTVERECDYKQEGSAVLVSFLIASPTLIGTIYHPLQPVEMIMPASEFLILLTHLTTSTVQIHPFLNHTHIHTRLTRSLSHTLFLRLNFFPSDEQRVVKGRREGLTFKSQHLFLSRISVTATTTLLPINHNLQPVSLWQYSVLSRILNVYKTSKNIQIWCLTTMLL